MINSVLQVEIEKWRGSDKSMAQDLLAVEEPLEIRLDYFDSEKNQRFQKSISITMRTPGHDFELAAGFLFTEGILQSPNEILKMDYCGPALPHLGHSNIVKIELAESVRPLIGSLERNFYTTSSCGVCGKASIDALETKNPFSQRPKDLLKPQLTHSVLAALPEKLRAAQSIFENTGGLHASALFTASGDLMCTREDVGRHNALDKVIGHSFLKNLMPLTESILLVSGRVSFELVQKATMAGIPILAAVGAPSSLAIELASKAQMSVVGFVRDGRFNIYCGAQRIL
jgi:FdhD protein